MAQINIDLYSVLDANKPEKEYDTILVFVKSKDFCDVGFFDGFNFKLWGRHKSIKHSDITHWAYMPRVKK